MSIFSGITVACFAASYSISLVLEATRLFFRSSVRGAVMLAFGAAGLLAHTLFLLQRVLNATGTPLSSAFDWYLVAAWILVVIYLFLAWYHPKTAVGLYLLPLVLGLILRAWFADRKPFPESDAGQVWGMIHGVFHLLGLVAVTVGFVAGIMHLIQSNRLKQKTTLPTGLKLPSLEWLERVNSRAIVISVLTIGTGFLSGMVLNLVLHRRQLNDEVPWNDPIIWRSAAMFGWLLVIAIFSAIYRPARRGRKVAYLTVASFVFLVASVGVGLLLPSEHGTKQEGGGRKVQGGRDQKSNLGHQMPTSTQPFTHSSHHPFLSSLACRFPPILEVRR
ncbi:MAG: cytochrome c biogenesis protein CcsA [Pirellulales bacterium]|nr:cytochrome c biogenesis protein CcsA [Pirellulales bacterium]